MENESSMKELINNSLEQVRSVIDTDTIIGQPIRTENGTVIIPVSKVSIALATGGLDLPQRNTDGTKNFGGGGGTGVSISPIGFLTVSPGGSVEMLPITPTNSSPIEQVADILDHTPDVIARIKAIFTDKKEQKSAEDAAAEEAAAKRIEEQLHAEAEAEAAIAKEISGESVAPLSKKEARKAEKAEKKLAKEKKKNQA